MKADWSKKKYTVTLTGNQANIILNALINESNEDAVERGEYSYFRCYKDFANKLEKQGFWES